VAVLITVAIPTIVAGGGLGLFLKLSLAIRREDRVRGSLRRGALSPRDRTVRSLVGVHSSGWD